MKYTGKWYHRVFRYIQVKWFLLTKRYKPVHGGINFYADTRLGGVGVKGYYWKPMSYTVYATLFGYTIKNHNVLADTPETAIKLVKTDMCKQGYLWHEAQYSTEEEKK